MVADKPLRLCGAVKAASATNKEKGPTRPAPRFHLFGPKRREALPLALTIDLHPHPCPRVQVLRASRILPRHFSPVMADILEKIPR